MKYFALVSLVLIGSQAVGGGQVLNNSELDGNELLKDRRAAVQVLDSGKTQDSAGASKCFGYLKGFEDGMIALAAANPSNRWSFICPNAETTVNQQLKIVTNYLTAHPEDLYQHAQVLVSSALVHVFPCSAKNLMSEPSADR